ncbi:MAG: POTRA domain-containing protein [Thermoanaerobaculia bacterium]
MGRLRLEILLVLALAEAASPAAAAGTGWNALRSAEPAGIASELFGRPVESVAYTSNGEVDSREIESLMVLEVGRPLTQDDTGATIRNLYSTLNFSNILIEAEPAAGGGVAVIVHLWRAFRVRRIRLEGRASVSREDLRRAIPFSEGDPFNAAALAAGASALERRLGTDGYLHPSVAPEASFDEKTFSVEVFYRIAAGERARVAAPFFDGETAPFPPETLEQKARVKPGARYRESKARSDAERIRRFLLEQGHFKASVELIAAEPTEDGRLRPVDRITVGPRFDLETTGIKAKTARREILALAKGQSFDEDLLQQWVDTTRRALQRAGHYRARVTAAASEGADPVAMKLGVEDGPKYAVEKIHFSGNASVPEETLRGMIVTREKGFPVLRKGRLLDSDLDEDVGAILGYYQTHGWVAARIERPAVMAGSKPGLLDVTIAIREGPRAFIADRRIEGADHLRLSEIDRLVSVRIGQPFNPSAVRQDALALTAHYRNEGWREAVVQDRCTLSDNGTRAEVVFRVEEGLRSFFGKTIVRGNAVTDRRRILRQVNWKEGEAFSEEKIADTQQNLARTGAFRSIGVRPQPVDPDNQERNVNIDLTEARRLSLLYGVGYQYAPGATQPNDPFATVGVSYRNLFGSMRSASLEVQYAPLSQRGYIVAKLLEPYLFNTDIPLTFGAFASREPIQDIDINRLGVFSESVRLFRPNLRVGLRYSYQQIAPNNPEDLSTIELEKFPRSDQPIKQSAIGPSFFYDRRDDVLDPHAGYYWTLAGNYAFPFLKADARYGKVSAQAAYFKRFLGGVVAASVRAGGIFPYDLQAGVPVPIAERFFAGGSSNARGFDTDVGGIPGVTVDYNTQATSPPANGAGTGTCAQTYTFPDASQYDCSPGPRIIGGNGFMAWGLEYRFPIAGNLGVSVFYDLAQVWTNAGDMHLAIEGETGLRQSIGVGFHYMTPIGPLRLEVARPVELRTIQFLVTTTDQNNNVVVLGSGSTKETRRLLLSIGYPF